MTMTILNVWRHFINKTIKDILIVYLIKVKNVIHLYESVLLHILPFKLFELFSDFIVHFISFIYRLFYFNMHFTFIYNMEELKNKKNYSENILQ